MADIRGYRASALDVPSLVARIRGKGIALLRADRIYDREHLEHAARLAERAFAQGRARSADVATETLLYAAGERQIQKAIALLGLHEGARRIAAVAWAPAALDALAADLRWVRDDAALEGGASALDALGISAQERAMVPRERWGELVLERVALTDVLKS